MRKYDYSGFDSPQLHEKGHLPGTYAEAMKGSFPCPIG